MTSLVKPTFSLWILFLACGVAAQTRQKAPLDASVFGKWPSLYGSATISNDGMYVSYTIQNWPVGSQTLVVQAIKRNWKMEIAGAGAAAITQDSRTAVFIKPKDSLCLLKLSASSTEDIPDVSSFKLIKRADGEWLAYQLKSAAKELVVRDLARGNHKSFASVTSYLFSSDGNTLLLQTESKNEGATIASLVLVDIASDKAITIWQGAKASGFVFDASNTQLAFVVENKVGEKAENSLWYYKVGTEKAVRLADNQAAGIDSDLRIERIQRFSNDGSRLFFSLKEKDYPAPEPDAIKVDIWSYTDAKLQSQQLYQLAPNTNILNPGGPRSYTAVIQIDGHRIIRLHLEDEEISLGKTDDVALITHRKGDHYEEHWNRESQPSYYLVSTRNGERRQIKMNCPWPGVSLSPGGKYVYGRDDVYGDYLSYEVETGVTRNITEALPIPMTDKGYDGYALLSPPRGLRASIWLDNDEAVLIYDKYDVWQIDPAGKKPPVNVTNGYGRRHNIEFRLAGNYYGAFSNKDKLLLAAFNRSTKDGGFYSKRLDQKGDPELLTMGPYTYELAFLPSSPHPLPRARDAEVYLVRRSSATRAPNYFQTPDFKTFTPLSNVYPEAEYNWLTKELLTWKTLDGRSAQGILYKPENFDPKKKYPIIFHYYEKKSDDLNKYERPEPISGDLETCWFVSNGYLVFEPDILYKLGATGESVVNAVVSAANYLSKMPWVDATKMGISGHSFGGYETINLVAQTTLFAAAFSSSGYSNLISHYGSAMLGGGIGFHRYWAERGQGRIGATLWQRPDLYIKNSPIFRADKVTTPLLMMNNKQDGIVPFAEGIEFFTALRRLGRKVWMLQYDGEGHSLFNDKAKKQHTIRVTQFFDHYLKGAPAPKWMTEGVPARLKGIETGLELDMNGKAPGEGLLLENQGASSEGNEKGIKFEEGLSWDQVKAKAKAENKYIYVDAYATWCGPCKAMDKNVYSSEKVGAYFKDRFVSIKIQFDKTEQDSEEIKKWYADADAMLQQYKIDSFPTYLFFSPDCRIVHRDKGLKKIDDFIRLASEALDPSKQLYTLLEDYKQGRKNYKAMPALAGISAKYDKDIADAIIRDYKNNYLAKVDQGEVFTKETLWVINQYAAKFLFPEGSKGRLFQLFYHNTDRVDKAAERKGFAENVVKYVIRTEEIDDKLWQDNKPVSKNPDWEKMRSSITEKYSGGYADSLVPTAQLGFYNRIGDWREFAKLRDERIKEHPPKADKELFDLDGAWLLNSTAWDVFLHCDDKSILARALSWVELAIKLEEPAPDVQYLDTRANLLYKLGRVEEAIVLEAKAIELANLEAKKAGIEKSPLLEEFSKIVAKMKNGEPTWQVK